MVTVAALAAGAAIAISGCSAGKIAQTANQVAAVNGSSVDAEQISLRNAHIVYPGTGYTNLKGGSALLALSIINNSATKDDKLVSVTTDLGAVKITPASGQSAIVIAPQQNVIAAPKKTEASASDSHAAAPSGDKAATTNPEAATAQIEITGLTRDIIPGLTYSVVFNFENNGPVKIEVPVDAGTDTARHQSDKSGPAAEGGHGSSGGH
ncbi:hypothetical protein [Nocardia sp. NPDC005366]|uniref:hypothetical protein n=1 Tax=Nocardia sp. NPDC005366 TaxID=3156878 RepID=UPI0033B8F122